MPKGIKGFQKGHKIGVGRIFSEERRRKISESNKGRKVSAEGRANMSRSMKGRIISPEARKKISDKLKGKIPKNVLRGDFKGEKCHLWRGGITSENDRIRTSNEYKLWRKAIFERDNWTCVWCLQRGVPLEADHIKPFCDYPELRFAIDNGRSLCKPCHQKTDTYTWKARWKENESHNLY